MEALSANRLVCPVIVKIESARIPICSTTFASSNAFCRLLRISFCTCSIFRRISTALVFVCDAREWISSASVAPSCARVAISRAASSICCVILLIWSAEAAVSSVLAASSSVVADTSSISLLSVNTFASMFSTTLSMLTDSFLTCAKRPLSECRMPSSVFARFPKSSLRLTSFFGTFWTKSPSAIMLILFDRFLTEWMISTAIDATNTPTITRSTKHAPISPVILLVT